MSDVLDPAVNYTQPENQPYGMRIPEHAIRQLLSFAFKQIRAQMDQPRNLVDELFAQTSDEVRKQIKGWLRTHANMYIGVNWPTEDLHLPAIVVQNQGESEDTDRAFLGDRAGAMTFGSREGRPTAREHRAVLLRNSTSIFIVSDDVNLTMYLYYLARFVLFSNKDGLTEWYDIHNLVINGQDLQFDEKLFPIFGYYKMIQLQYQTVFDYNVEESIARIVSLDLMVATNNDEVEVVVGVPFGK